ncbi:hypothetical protein ACEPAG_7356 [Sanghuangporus baumii]
MVDVELPLTTKGTHGVLSQIKDYLGEKNVSARSYHHNGKWWIRCSTQIYNEVSILRGMNVFDTTDLHL